MKRMLLGVGNRLSRDDGVGPVLVLAHGPPISFFLRAA